MQLSGTFLVDATGPEARARVGAAAPYIDRQAVNRRQPDELGATSVARQRLARASGFHDPETPAPM